MSKPKNPTLRRRTKELCECAEDAMECQLLGYELKDLGSLLVKMAIHMNDLQRKVDSQAEYIKTLNADRKTEPQTNADQHVQRVEYVENVKRCRKCKHIENEYQTPISSDGSYYTYVVCTASECRYEPKTEPQTDYRITGTVGYRCSKCGMGNFLKNESNCVYCGEPLIKNEPQTDCEACELDGKADVCKICRVSNYEPHTDCAWMKGE